MAMMNQHRLFTRRLRTSGHASARTGLPGLLAMIVFLLGAVCIFLPASGGAQELTATLSGNVTDSSGAVIPHATVTITLNSVNGATRVVESDGSGNYIAPQLTAGTYSVSATAAGFQTFKVREVVLNVAERHTLNITLKAGATSETVVVEDNPVSVDTESSAQAGTISGLQVRELELSSRNFEQLVALQPGVVSNLGDESGPGATGLAVNGARATANNWTVDGADINDSGSNGTVINAPSVDAIQEFTLQRGSYDAGYGRSGGGQILVATKSGTSEFHGDAYEFVRNTVLDANEYFNKMTGGKRAVNHHNVYGFTIGGPVFIPKVYNADKKNSFFFWSEEWHKLSTPGSDTMAAASPSNLQGGFTVMHTTDANGNVIPATLPASYIAPTSGKTGCVTSFTVDPSTGDGSGTISPSCYSANSQVYLSDVFSKYAANSGTNYFFAYSAKNDFRDDIVRVDHYFSDKLHFYARGMNDVMPVNAPEGLWAGSNYPGLVNTLVDSPGKNIVGNLTWTISPTVVNEAEFVWSQGTYHSTIASGQFATSAAINSALTGNWAYPDPYGRVPGISITGSSIFPAVTGFNAGSAPWKERNLDRTYFDNLSLTLGNHTLRTGFQIQQMLKTENATFGEPNYSFLSWGDFLLGNVNSYSQTSRDIIPDLHYVNSEAYLQDDWKLTRKLTLNLGLRWSRFPSPTDVKNTLANFDPAYYSSLLAPAIDPTSGNFVPGQMVNGAELVPATYANGLIFPKGAACNSAQSIAPLVQCSPFGKYVNPNYNANFGPRIGFAYNPDGRGITSIRGGFGIFYDRVLNGIWEQNAFNDPPLAQKTTVYNGTFDKILGTAAATSYGPNGITATGNPTFRVPNYANFNLSVQRQLLPTTTLEVAYVGNVARHLLGELDLNQPTVAAATIAGPAAYANAQRPYRGYSEIQDRSPIFTNNYNSLQVSVNHRSSKGLTVGIAYTWSKDLTTNSNDRGSIASDTYDLKMDYGPSTLNMPHVFEANYVYTLPFFKTQSGFEGKVLGGWEISGITSMVSGSSFSATAPLDSNFGLGRSAGRPDQVSAVHMLKHRTAWFSTSSYRAAAGFFGTESSNNMIGPGLQNWDLAAIKNVKFFERYSFQLRGEFFNAFNHENFSTVDSNISDGTFGQVTAGHVPRRVQIGAKLYF